MEKSSNDNGAAHRDLNNVDAHGYAALQLTESLIHSLIDRSIIDLGEAQNVVSIAIDATEALADELPLRSDGLRKSIFLLTDIRHSLGHIE